MAPSSWMITPTVNVQNGDIISFWTRTVDYATGGSQYPDRLELRMSTAGNSTINPSNEIDLGTFTNNLLTINPDLTSSAYPEEWTQYTIVVSGLSENTECQFAFRYFVTNGGTGGTNSNYIGVDGFSIKRPTWTLLNKSNPIGTQTSGWFQGNSSVFSAQTGNATEYIGANFNSTANIGTISSWLITPVISLQNDDMVSFWSRTASNGIVYPDRMEIRLSTLGESSVYPTNENNVGSFTTLLTVINPNLTTTDYPQTWTEFTNAISGLSGLTDCKIAFRYYVISGGSGGSNSNYIGLDTFTVTRPELANHLPVNNTQFRIYPNPVSNTINISFPSLSSDNASIRIIDILGKEVASYPNLALQSNTLSLNVPENMTEGVYMIIIKTEEQQFIQKLIKNK